jgi:hypothetical protein
VYAQQTLYAGQNAIGQGTLNNPVIIAKTTGSDYVQGAIINATNTGSADWIAYSDTYPGPSDDHGWIDMGMAGSNFNDSNYTISKPHDGYIFSGSTTGAPGGGNLIFATDSTGTVKDIVFATGGFLEANEKFRFVHASNKLVPYANATMGLGNTTNYFGNVYADKFIGDGSLLTGVTASASLPIANGNSNIDISTANSNVTITSNGTYTWTFDDLGNLIIPGSITSSSTLSINNSLTTSDINVNSGDDITLQAKDRTLGEDAEGGDINIYGGDGSPDDGTGTAGSGGDLQIYAGDGGDANVFQASGGGTTLLRGGRGGDASVTAAAGQGGYVEISAGDSGYDNGNALLGNIGGYITIQAGDTNLEASNGGYVSIRPGAAGPNAIAGYVEINIPSSANGPGGIWSFNGSGNLLNTPQNAEIFSPSAGNIKLGSAGNVFIQSTDYANLIAHTWSFGNFGNFYLADGNSFIKSVPNNAGDLSGLSTLNLYPDITNDDRYLVVDPTGPNHIHIRAGGLQDASNALLYLGGEQAYVQIDDSTHEVQIGSYDSANTTSYTWRFENDGTFTVAGDITTSGNISATNIGNISATNLDGNAANVLTGSGTFTALPVINANTVVWTTAPVSNTSTGIAGQAAYDTGGNLYVCVTANTWAKFTGTTSW